MKNSYPKDKYYPIRIILNFKLWILRALILVGALVACSPIQTPVAVTTATIIPSTTTPTSLPISPTATPEVSATPANLGTDSLQSIPTLMDTEIDLDPVLSRQIVDDLAERLTIPISRIQIVSAEWISDNLGCGISATFYDGVSISAYPLDNQATGLHYVLVVGYRLYDYYTDGAQNFVPCPGNRLVSGEILLAVDPLAAEIFRSVQNLLAGELDLSSRRVQVVDMIPVVWQDTSLGCPQAGRTYTDATIPGYHIVITAGNESYVYHSDSNTAYRCDPALSILPEN